MSAELVALYDETYAGVFVDEQGSDGARIEREAHATAIAAVAEKVRRETLEEAAQINEAEAATFKYGESEEGWPVFNLNRAAAEIRSRKLTPPDQHQTEEWALRRVSDGTIQPVSSRWVAQDVVRTESGLVAVSRQVTEWQSEETA